MLLDDLIADLSNQNENLTGILLRTKVFMHQIGKKGLADWVKFELEGYPDDDSTPDYRQLPGQLMGNVVSVAWRYSSHPLPTSHIPADIRDRFLSSVVRQPISTIETWCKDAGGNAITRPIPLELNGVIGKTLANGVHLESAWVKTPIADVKNILAQVRSRLLDFFLELKDNVGDVGETEQVRSKVKAEVDATGLFNRAIFGPNATIVIGDHGAITASNVNSTGDMCAGVESLLEQLNPLLETAQLPPLVQAHAQAQMLELAAAAQEPTPDTGRLRTGLQALGKVLEGAAGNLVASGALAAIKALLGAS